MLGFPGATVVKNPPANAGDSGDTGSIPELGRCSGEGKGNTLVFLPGKSHGQRRLVGYSPWGCKETRLSEHACIRTHTQVHVATEMNLENLMLNEIHQSQMTAFCSTPWTQLSD